MNNGNSHLKKLKQEDGVTLVELLAAIAILSIIVTAFLGFFVQAGRTNNMTNEVNEATFLAQEEMEQITYLSQNENTLQQVKDYYSGNGYAVTQNTDSVSISKNGSYSLQLNLYESTIESVEESQTELHNAIVTVTKGGQSRAKMETVVPFAKESTPEG